VISARRVNRRSAEVLVFGGQNPKRVPALERYQANWRLSAALQDFSGEIGAAPKSTRSARPPCSADGRHCLSVATGEQLVTLNLGADCVGYAQRGNHRRARRRLDLKLGARLIVVVTGRIGCRYVEPPHEIEAVRSTRSRNGSASGSSKRSATCSPRQGLCRASG